MRVKIVGNGLVGNTKLVSLETGEEINGVTGLWWELDAMTGVSRCLVEFKYVPIDVVLDVNNAIAWFPSREFMLSFFKAKMAFGRIFSKVFRK